MLFVNRGFSRLTNRPTRQQAICLGLFQANSAMIGKVFVFAALFLVIMGFSVW
ncbi:MAG: hypothetical protein HQM16_06930 [Deltaproteobacteria bacterium]|nr:hypothetical protein [Deltaproteobacteria bacterium]